MTSRYSCDFGCLLATFSDENAVKLRSVET